MHNNLKIELMQQQGHKTQGERKFVRQDKHSLTEKKELGELIQRCKGEHDQE